MSEFQKRDRVRFTREVKMLGRPFLVGDVGIVTDVWDNGFVVVAVENRTVNGLQPDALELVKRRSK